MNREHARVRVPVVVLTDGAAMRWNCAECAGQGRGAATMAEHLRETGHPLYAVAARHVVAHSGKGVVS